MPERKDIKREIAWRLGLFYYAMLLFGIVIIGRVLYLQWFEYNKWNQAQSVTLKEIPVDAKRGDIYSNDGELLVTSVAYYEIYMDLHCEALTDKVFRKGIDSLSLCLSQMFYDPSKPDNKSTADWKKELKLARHKNERYHLISKKVDYSQLKRMKTFPIFRLGQYKGGFISSVQDERKKPFKTMASRTIGRVRNKVEARSTIGIEGAYEYFLRGTNGMRVMQKLSGGVWMPIGSDNEIEPKDGMDVVTTIDVDIQDVAEQALLRQLVANNAEHGTAVVMEVSTGYIKAITNLDRNNNGTYTESYNYAVGESSEPGSTFKLASLMVGMEDGYINLNDTVHTGDGIRTFYGFPIRDTKQDGLGTITVQQAFELSSNVGIASLIWKYYRKNERKFIDRIYSFNLNDKLSLEIKGEGMPQIKYPDDTLWTGVSLPQVSIGYEVKLTPLQILTFYNAVANNGNMVKPIFVKGISYHGVIKKTFDTQVINYSICSQQTIKKAKKMLEGVVERGTAKNIKNDKYKIAGKTGTAQVAKLREGYKIRNKDSEKISYQASFVGYFPADNPKYSCIVVISSPSNMLYYGSEVAAPVFREISDKIFCTRPEFFLQIDSTQKNIADLPVSMNGYRADILGIMSCLQIPNQNSHDLKSNWLTTNKSSKAIKLDNRFVTRKVVPNVVGMGLKDAIYLLESVGLLVLTEGKGMVTKQSVQAGTAIKKGLRIKIELG